LWSEGDTLWSEGEGEEWGEGQGRGNMRR
jgi:hypothetical protein